MSATEVESPIAGLIKIDTRDGGAVYADEDGAKRIEEIRAFAAARGILDRFEQKLSYLGTYADGRTICRVWKDFAFMSMAFCWFRAEEPYKQWMNGGFIYDGPEAACDGSFPQLTVSLEKTDGQGSWSINT